MKRLRRLWARLEVLGILAFLILSGCAGAASSRATDFAMVSQCHEAAAAAADCHAAEVVFRDNPACQLAFPYGASICSKDGGR